MDSLLILDKLLVPPYNSTNDASALCYSPALQRQDGTPGSYHETKIIIRSGHPERLKVQEPRFAGCGGIEATPSRQHFINANSALRVCFAGGLNLSLTTLDHGGTRGITPEAIRIPAATWVHPDISGPSSNERLVPRRL